MEKNNTASRYNNSLITPRDYHQSPSPLQTTFITHRRIGIWLGRIGIGSCRGAIVALHALAEFCFSTRVHIHYSPKN
eukprot:scaffold5915_cov128-Isochrysis_galbana.AAC.4